MSVPTISLVPIYKVSRVLTPKDTDKYDQYMSVILPDIKGDKQMKELKQEFCEEHVFESKSEAETKYNQMLEVHPPQITKSYKLQVRLERYTGIKDTEINSLNIIGQLSGWNWDDATNIYLKDDTRAHLTTPGICIQSTEQDVESVKITNDKTTESLLILY